MQWDLGWLIFGYQTGPWRSASEPLALKQETRLASNFGHRAQVLGKTFLKRKQPGKFKERERFFQAALQKKRLTSSTSTTNTVLIVFDWVNFFLQSFFTTSEASVNRAQMDLLHPIRAQVQLEVHTKTLQAAPNV